MKILLVTTKANPGGVQTFLGSLARFLVDNGHEVMVAAGRGAYLPDQLADSSVIFRRLTSLSGRLSVWSVISYIKELRVILRSWPADVVHFNSSYALFGVLGQRKADNFKTVFTVHGLSVLDKGYKTSWRRFPYRFMYRFLFSFVDSLVFVSKSNLEEAKAQNLVARGEVIYNGLDKINFPTRDEARVALSRLVGQDLSGFKIVGSVGRLCYQKNYSFLISQWPQVISLKPDAKLVIIGQGEDKARLHQMINELSLSDSVFIVEAAPATPYLTAFDLFVLTSRYEGLPISLIEALSANLAVLASRVGGNEEILRHLAELYEEDNQEAFLSSLIKLIDNEVLRQEVLAINNESLSDFGILKMGRNYLELYYKKL